MYCECFAKGLICGVDCDCKDCHNNEENNDLRELVIQETLEKNPKAFTSKYKKIETKDETDLDEDELTNNTTYNSNSTIEQIKNSKKYTPINSYKPSGKLVYSEDLLAKLGNKMA